MVSVLSLERISLRSFCFLVRIVLFISFFDGGVDDEVDADAEVEVDVDIVIDATVFVMDDDTRLL